MERSLEGHNSIVCALAAWSNHLISASGDHTMRVWDVTTGTCEKVLTGHTDWVRALAVSGDCLISASYDRHIKLWRLGADITAWCCTHTLIGDDDSPVALAAAGETAVSGSNDGRIRAWDLGAAAQVAVFRAHEDFVRGLVLDGPTLYSSADDGTVRAWSVASWADVRPLRELSAAADGVVVRCLAVSGARLVGGPSSSGDLQRELLVWDLESPTAEPEHRLRLPVGASVWVLVAAPGCVWGGVGGQVVVWGRR